MSTLAEQMAQAAESMRALSTALREGFEADPLPWIAHNDPLRYISIVRAMRREGIIDYAAQRQAARDAVKS